MTMSIPFRVKRFVIIAVFATVAVVGLFVLVFFVFPDIAPPTPFESFCTFVWIVASWPVAVVWSMLQKDPPLVVFIALWIASGLFWAFIVELFLMARRRLRTKAPLDSN